MNKNLAAVLFVKLTEITKFARSLEQNNVLLTTKILL
jgi:hypothetical protein